MRENTFAAIAPLRNRAPIWSTDLISHIFYTHKIQYVVHKYDEIRVKRIFHRGLFCFSTSQPIQSSNLSSFFIPTITANLMKLSEIHTYTHTQRTGKNRRRCVLEHVRTKLQCYNTAKKHHTGNINHIGQTHTHIPTPLSMQTKSRRHIRNQLYSPKLLIRTYTRIQKTIYIIFNSTRAKYPIYKK